MSKRLTVYLAGLTLVACATLTPSIAFGSTDAADEVTADDAISAIRNVASGTDEQIANPGDVEIGAANVTVESDLGTVATVPLLEVAPIEIETAELVDETGDIVQAAQSVTVSLPTTATGDSPEIGTDGSVTFPSASAAATTVIPAGDGSVQFLTTIANSSAAERYVYDFGLPEGARLTVNEANGAVMGLDRDGGLIFVIAPAWALDADSNPVPTHYEVDDHTVTQVVEHRASDTASYPIVADPWMGMDLIANYKWVGPTSAGNWKISVAVTATMGWVTSDVANYNGWPELVTKVTRTSAFHLARLNSARATYSQQWMCHAIGKAAIGIGTWLGVDGSPTWDLESWRPVLGQIDGRSTWQIAETMVQKRCNW
ncbi:hypothetical protein [Microbacterium gilvum]|uniref:DUF2599 domain-containing protein n=1 Tax=Microbacterium gilvum TaxID=1336204 RepID=A0ABP8ZZ81_9MICO